MLKKARVSISLYLLSNLIYRAKLKTQLTLHWINMKDIQRTILK